MAKTFLCIREAIRQHHRTLTAVAVLLIASAVQTFPAAYAEQGDGVLIPGRPQLKLNTGRVALRDSRAVPEADPFLRVLSGPGWRMSMGLDPRLAKRDGWNTLTRSNIRMSPGAGSNAPAMQVGGVSVPFRDPAPAFSRNLLITRDYSNSPVQLEPHIAVDPKDPDHVIVVAIDYNFPGVSVYTTFDGGETWEGPIQARYLREDLIAGGDPVVAFDRKGNAHIISISIGIEEFQVGRFSVVAPTSAIAITTSLDGGLTWSDPVATARKFPFTDLGPPDSLNRVRGNILVPFLDKPWFSVGPDPQDPTRDLIHVTYTEFVDVFEVLYLDELPTFAGVEMRTTIRTVRSTDLGKTWADSISVSPTVTRTSAGGAEPGQTISEGQQRVVQGSEPRVAADGTLYVSWMDSTDDDSQKGLAEIYVARSDDGGKSFGQPVRVSVFNEPGFRSRIAFFRYWATAFPRLSTGPGGEVYIVYGGLNPGRLVDDGDIYFVRSLDKGQTWTRPKRLSGDETSSLQFFPAISTDPKGGLHVMWGDMRHDPRQTSYHIYYTTSADKGDTWGFVDAQRDLRTDDTRVTDFPSNPNLGFPGGLFIGDYFAIAAAEEEVYLVWADTRLGEFGGGFNQKVGFARKRAIASPEVFISPPTGAGGQQITVQGFNLQPGIIAYVQIGGVVVSTERTNSEGRFTSRIFVPITGEGAQDVRIIDESGNIASTSYYTDFGFNTIQDELKSLRTSLGQLATPTPSSQSGGGGCSAPLARTGELDVGWLLVGLIGPGTWLARRRFN